MTPSDYESRAKALGAPSCDERDEELAASLVPKEERTVLSITTGEPVTAVDEKPSAPLFRFLPVSEFLTPPTPPVWVIEGIAETNSLSQLFGDPEAGKSFMAIDWACCVATGQPWKGREVRQGAVLYINGEGRNGFNRRLHAWQIANKVGLAGAPLFLSSTSTALTDPTAKLVLEATIAGHLEAHGQPAMIVIDTLARNFGPGDENETRHMAAAIATLDSIREMTEALTLAVHHSGHGDKDRARGNSAMKGAVDTEYRMGRITPGGDTLLRSNKMKDGSAPPPMTFRFADVELGIQDRHGNPVTSAVLIETHADVLTPGAPPVRTGHGKNQSTALKLLVDMYARRRGNVARDGRDPDSVRVTLTEWREACRADGMAKNRVGEVTVSLIDAGKVVEEAGYVLLGGFE